MTIPLTSSITHKKLVSAGRKSFGQAFGAAAPSPSLLTRFLTRQSEVVARTSAPASTCSCLLPAEPSIPTSAPHSSAGNAAATNSVKASLDPSSPARLGPVVHQISECEGPPAGLSLNYTLGKVLRAEVSPPTVRVTVRRRAA